MNKHELVKAVANESGLTQSQTKTVLDAFTSVVASELNKENDVVIYRFGKFYSSQFQERVGRNPKTGEPVFVPARRIAKFKPSPELKLLVR